MLSHDSPRHSAQSRESAASHDRALQARPHAPVPGRPGPNRGYPPRCLRSEPRDLQFTPRPPIDDSPYETQESSVRLPPERSQRFDSPCTERERDRAEWKPTERVWTDHHRASVYLSPDQSGRLIRPRPDGAVQLLPKPPIPEPDERGSPVQRGHRRTNSDRERCRQLEDRFGRPRTPANRAPSRGSR